MCCLTLHPLFIVRTEVLTSFLWFVSCSQDKCPTFSSLTTLKVRMYQVPKRIFQTLTQIESRQLFKWEEFHDNLTSGTQTQLRFLDFHCQHSPLLHRACGRGRFLPKMLFLAENHHLSLYWQAKWERPIQCVLHIILLKCTPLYVTAPSISAHCE